MVIYFRKEGRALGEVTKVCHVAKKKKTSFFLSDVVLFCYRSTRKGGFKADMERKCSTVSFASFPVKSCFGGVPVASFLGEKILFVSVRECIGLT